MAAVEGHARGDQLHGAARARPDLPGDDARAARPARDSARGQRQLVAPRHRDVRVDRRARGHHHRHLGGGPRRDGARGDRPRVSMPRDLSRPGHVFPLRARNGGVLVRAGHTEAAVDLARIAGLEPAGVICEIMNDDGTMARVPELTKFAPQARPADDHDRGSDPVPDADRAAGEARRHGEAADRARRVPPVRLREPDRRRDARGAGARRHRRRQGRAGARALEVPDRRRVPLGALRLRPAARRGAGAHRRRRAAASCCT